LRGRGNGEWPGRRDCDSDSDSGCLQPEHDGGSRAGSAAGEPGPENGSKVGDRSLRELESIPPLGSTSENLIAFGSVSTPLGREAGVVGGGGEKIREEEGVGEGLDASVTPGTPGILLMVDGTRRSTGSLAN
jgi:hypothetical protein